MLNVTTTGNVGGFFTPWDDGDDSLDEIGCANSGSDRAPTVFRKKRSLSTPSVTPAAHIRSSCLSAYANNTHSERRRNKKPGRRKARRWANDELCFHGEGEMSCDETDEDMEGILSHLNPPCTAGMSSIVFLASEGPEELVNDIFHNKENSDMHHFEVRSSEHHVKGIKDVQTEQFLLIPRRLRRILARTVVHNNTLLDLLHSFETSLSTFFTATEQGTGGVLTPFLSKLTPVDGGYLRIEQINPGPNGSLEFWNPSSIHRLFLQTCCMFYNLSLAREYRGDEIDNSRDLVLKISQRLDCRAQQQLLSKIHLGDVILARSYHC